ncbi:MULTISPECIES: hypothetical protein [Pannonibacter]|uniref:hypothetical protein n=1 Tax=Pannonibacter TaxID=227873 RepID=UPI000F44AD8C|nr:MULTISPECIES: hypothetical protein [Pannonibacter]MBA4207764.1 hypothetical protein [Polymorphum sp.]
MTKLLEQALDQVRRLPPEQQDELARLLLSLAGSEDDMAVYELDPEEIASLSVSRSQAARGEFASDDHVRAVWAKHGL